MKDSEVIREGIKVLSKYGWHQGSVGSTEDGFCGLGAVAYVMNINKSGVSRMLPIVEALSGYSSDSWAKSFAEFNDDPRTSYEDVVLTMKQAAFNLEEEGK